MESTTAATITKGNTMSLITDHMTTEAAALLERSLQHYADTATLVDDIKAFSLRRGDSIPASLSLQAQDELYGWSTEALGVQQMYSLLDAVISTIVSHHDSGTFEPWSDAETAARVEGAKLALQAIRTASAN